MVDSVLLSQLDKINSGFARPKNYPFSKIKKVLGWQPKYSFQSGIEKTIEHYKKSI